MLCLKRFGLTILGACLMLGPATYASAAQNYPTHPIRIIVPWPAGGVVDILGRVVGQKLEKSLGQPIIVEDKPGAGSILGANEAAAASPDGYTLLLTSSGLTMNAALRPHLFRFNVLTGLEPIVLAATAPSVLVVNPSLPVHTAKQLIALAKSKPGKITVGSAGIGSPAFFFEKRFAIKTGIKAVDIPYKGAPPLMNAQIAGQITFHFANLNVALPQIKAGTVRALATTTRHRLAALPNVPTMAQAGVPFVAEQWFGYFAPGGTPKPIVERIAKAVNAALALPKVQKILEKNGMTVDDSSSPASFSGHVRKDIKTYQNLIKVAHITVQ